MKIDMTNFQKISVKKKPSNKNQYKQGWKYERRQQRRNKNSQLGR